MQEYPWFHVMLGASKHLEVDKCFVSFSIAMDPQKACTYSNVYPPSFLRISDQQKGHMVTLFFQSAEVSGSLAYII